MCRHLHGTHRVDFLEENGHGHDALAKAVAFRKHDVAVFHLLDQQELDFDFDRPARFIDMEGGEAILADPSLIARNYREAVRLYMHEIDELVRTTAIDYHRVKLHEKYDDVLAKFLLARIQKKGGR
jgi:hypothetical protein